MTRIYAPFEAEHCEEARDAIEAFVSEVRAKVKVANLDDPKALVAWVNADGRKANNSLPANKRSEIEEAIRNGGGLGEVCRQFDVSTPTYYRYHAKVFLKGVS